MRYTNYLRSKHWKDFSKLAKSGRRNKCRICKSKENLHTHHIKYRKFDRGVLFKETLSDVKTLCKECHFMWHEVQGKRPFRSKHASRINNLVELGCDKESAFASCVGEKYKEYREHLLTNE